MTTLEIYLDNATILAFGLLAKVLLAFLFFFFWFRSRQAVWFAWWGASLLLGSAAAATAISRGIGANFHSLGLAGAGLIVTFGCCWQGARAFERRRPLWSPVIAALTIWLVASLTPAFFERDVYRVILSSLLLAPLTGLTAFEFWRGREERLPSRWLVIALFASLAAVFAIRIPLVGIAPFPFGANPAQIGWVSVFNIVMFLHTAILVVLLVALTKERFELEQRAVANTDPLTGVPNRRALAVRGRRLLARHERGGQELAVLFLDIDDFKRINDRYGHSGGDEMLKCFVEIVSDNIRPTDFLFRVGGEEFCCLLPETGMQQGRWAAERIRGQIETATFNVGGVYATATVSIGLASTSLAGYDLDALLAAADDAVYAAKRLGRNRVVAAETKEHAFARSIAWAGFDSLKNARKM